MLFTPTALILADHAQRNLLTSARLDGPTTAPAAQYTARITRPAGGCGSWSCGPVPPSEPSPLITTHERIAKPSVFATPAKCSGAVREGLRWRGCWSPGQPRVLGAQRRRNCCDVGTESWCMRAIKTGRPPWRG